MIHSGNEMIFLNGTRGGSAAPLATSDTARPASPTASAVRFWNVASTSSDEGELTIYGDILPETPRDWWTGEVIEGRYVTPEGFDEALAAVRNKKNVTVRINSLGGDLYTGIAIHDALRDLPARVTVIVEGIAASAASVIAMAGDEVRVHPGDTIMIHGVAALLWDYYGIDELKKVVRSFEAAEKAIARIYAERTGLTEERLREMMSRETWMVGKDAVELGFADTLIGEAGPGLVASADRRVLLVAGVRHDVTGLHLPGWIPSAEIEGAGDAQGAEGTQGAQGRGPRAHRAEGTSASPTGGAGSAEGGAAGAAHLNDGAGGDGAASVSFAGGCADVGGAARAAHFIPGAEGAQGAQGRGEGGAARFDSAANLVRQDSGAGSAAAIGDGANAAPDVGAAGHEPARDGVRQLAAYLDGIHAETGDGTGDGSACGGRYAPAAREISGCSGSDMRGATAPRDMSGETGREMQGGALREMQGEGALREGIQTGGGEAALVGNRNHIREEDAHMTLEELRAQEPALVAQIEAAAEERGRSAALTEERARLQAIEEIENAVGDRNLVAAAKYGENPLTAGELALAAMRQQAAIGRTQMEAMRQDTAAAQTEAVAAAGNAGIETGKTDESPEARREAGRRAAKMNHQKEEN